MQQQKQNLQKAERARRQHETPSAIRCDERSHVVESAWLATSLPPWRWYLNQTLRRLPRHPLCTQTLLRSTRLTGGGALQRRRQCPSPPVAATWLSMLPQRAQHRVQLGKCATSQQILTPLGLLSKCARLQRAVPLCRCTVCPKRYQEEQWPPLSTVRGTLQTQRQGAQLEQHNERHSSHAEKLTQSAFSA